MKTIEHTHRKCNCSCFPNENFMLQKVIVAFFQKSECCVMCVSWFRVGNIKGYYHNGHT